MRHAIRVAHDGLHNTLPDVQQLFNQALAGAEDVPGGTGEKFPIRVVFGSVLDTLKSNRNTLEAALAGNRPC